MTGIAIDLRRKAYATDRRLSPQAVFEHFKLTIADGTFVCLSGASGCGKTTLLNIVAGLDGDFEGEVRFPEARNPAAVRLGYVFQEPRLFPGAACATMSAYVLPVPRIALPKSTP